jgi:hypothetical protein
MPRLALISAGLAAHGHLDHGALCVALSHAAISTSYAAAFFVAFLATNHVTRVFRWLNARTLVVFALGSILIHVAFSQSVHPALSRLLQIF